MTPTLTETKVAPKSYPPSAQQQKALDFTTNDRRSFNLVARAGCGKSTTLKMITAHLFAQALKPRQVWLCAYNKPIADQLGAEIAAMGFKFPEVIVSTMHSGGWGLIRKFYTGTKIVKDKVRKIVDGILESQEDLEQYADLIVKAVSLGKQRAFGFLTRVEDTSEWFKLMDHFGLDDEFNDQTPVDFIIDTCIAVMLQSFKLDSKEIDFDDMINAPLVHNIPVRYPFDWVLGDEMQDTNPARRALAIKMLKPVTGRLIACGDPAQAIYGFTGADSDSMDLIKAQLGSAELPLNVTYRCPKAVVRLANRWVPDLVAHETAPEGIVRNVKLNPNASFDMPTLDLNEMTANDVVLCRNNKPLVEMAYSLIRRGIACYVEGREIGTGLVRIIQKWKVKNISALLTSLTGYQESEVQKLVAKGKETKAEDLNDRCETIMILAQKCLDEKKFLVSDLIALINSLFSTTPEGEQPKVLTLSSIHKSKGREWKRVYILGRNKYMPSRWARKEWQLEQERNLCYVAVTRAKWELVEIFVEGK